MRIYFRAKKNTRERDIMISGSTESATIQNVHAVPIRNFNINKATKLHGERDIVTIIVRYFDTPLCDM